MLAWGQTYVPPDRFGDEHKGAAMLRRNMGQVFDTDGNQRNDVKAYFEGAPIGLYLRDSSRVSFTFTAMHKDSLTPDTTYRVDMAFAGAYQVAPDLVVPAPGVANYYRGAVVAEQVPAFRRGVYQEVAKDIDFHMYGSTGGPRMAFVVKPGGNPDNIKLAFTGQDSLNIDWMGSLKAYLNGKWVELKQAIAYQVAGNGSMNEVPWTPQWIHQDGTIYAKLTFGTYDHNLPLVLQVGYAAMGGVSTIEPRNMEWSTFIGGFGADDLTDVQMDQFDAPYVCGSTWSDYFPVVTGDASFNPFLGEAVGALNAVVMKFDHTTKHILWGTYYSGSNAAYDGLALTDARKLAVPQAAEGPNDYVFAVGTTNCLDFNYHANPNSVFANAVVEPYTIDRQRMWLGAFNKNTGTRDWATTHGLANASFGEHGLAIAYDPTGGLAVGGRIYRYLEDYTPPAFPCVTPTGAYQQAAGGGFIMLFNGNFQVRWSTAFGGYDEYSLGLYDQRTQVTDLCFAKADGLKLWLTGASTGDGMAFLPAPLSPGQAYSNTEGMAMLAAFDVTSLHLDYSTLWGRDRISVGYAIDFDGKNVWVAGGTESQNLTAADCPPPTGSAPGIHHTHANSSPDPYIFTRSDGFILAVDPFLHRLRYGTLFGGAAYDMLLDACHDDDHVYFIGETRSTAGFGEDLDPSRFFQPLHANGYSRDAVILALDKDVNNPVVAWNTAYGGTKSERGWAIASTKAGVYIVGTTASNQWEEFPLLDFNPDSDQDFYQWYNLQGGHELDWAGFSFLPFYSFEYSLNYLHTFYYETAAESEFQDTDGFIAFFNAFYHVGVEAPQAEAQALTITPLPVPGQWAVNLPGAGPWRLSVVNSAGQQVMGATAAGRSTTVDLRNRASGMYLLRAVAADGTMYHGKIVQR
ncbi:MAG TPA: T9SS type A sorting domain-containing protein [Flavobacteriales bacterium]|nr:T9SS type A sorting domain-containing protein [Flavobacteriales bacterium]